MSHIVEKTLNGAEYIEKIVGRQIVPQMKDWFPLGDGIFQQDRVAMAIPDLRSQAYRKSVGSGEAENQAKLC